MSSVAGEDGDEIRLRSASVLECRGPPGKVGFADEVLLHEQE